MLLPSIMEVQDQLEVLEFWCHAEALGAAHVEHRGLKNLLETGPLVLLTLQEPCGRQRL